MREMVTPDEALNIVLQHAWPLLPEIVPHEMALGRVLARDVTATSPLPPFDNSAMDGFALLAADAQYASTQSPAILRVGETLAAGDVAQEQVIPGRCARIMTGAPLPLGADAVVMREETEVQPDGTVAILAVVQAGQHIRRAGSDVQAGEGVLTSGTRVRPSEWGMLASLDCAQVEVFACPRVGLITTGEELLQVGEAGRPGAIRDSNSWTLCGLAQSCGAMVVRQEKTGDEARDVERALRACLLDCDAIVTSGGVSMGDFDPVRDVLRDQAEVLFWKIAMKPGKPVMFALMQSSNGRRVPVFGLPGNPVSVMVAWENFVRPALLQMSGQKARRRVQVRAVVPQGFASPPGKTEFARALVLPDETGPTGWRALLPGDQGSGRLSTMTRANALLLVPAETTQVQAGDVLLAMMTDWPEIE